MGPNVKLFHPSVILFPKEKIGVIFLSVKIPYRGGPRGGLAKDHKKYGFFFGTFPLDTFCGRLRKAAAPSLVDSFTLGSGWLTHFEGTAQNYLAI